MVVAMAFVKVAIVMSDVMAVTVIFGIIFAFGFIDAVFVIVSKAIFAVVFIVATSTVFIVDFYWCTAIVSGIVIIASRGTIKRANRGGTISRASRGSTIGRASRCK